MQFSSAYDGIMQHSYRFRATDSGSRLFTPWFRYAGVVTATDGAGAVTHYSYDSQHQLLTVIDGNGHTVESNSYTSLGRVAQQTDANNQVTGFSYAGQSASGSLGPGRVTDPRGVTTDYYNDGNRRLTQRDVYMGIWWVTDVQRTLWTYDANSNVASVTDANGIVPSFTADSQGNVLSRTVDPSGLNLGAAITYDGQNDLVTATDPNGHTTQFTYDGHGNLLSKRDALNQTTGYGYDATGQRTTVTDVNGHTTTFGYSAAGDVTSVSSADAATTVMGYDAAGNRASVTTANGTVIRSGYDARNRLVEIDLGNHGAYDIQYGYGGGGHRTSLVDSTGSTTSTYDAANRLTAVAAPVTGTIAYAYNAAGERVGLPYPGGHTVTYGYSGRGQLASVTNWQNHTTTYSYDNAGRLTAAALPNGVASQYTYDHADRLTGISYARGATSLEAITYARNAVGTRAAMTDSTGTTSWGYDALDRLTSATYPNADQVGYGYDIVGNRTSQTVNGMTTSSSYADCVPRGRPCVHWVPGSPG